MKKVLMALIIIVIIAAGILYVAKDIIAQRALSAGIEAATGLKATTSGVKVDILNTLVSLHDLQVLNPLEFKDKVMVDMPVFFVDFNLDALLKNQVHLWEARLNLRELVLVKNEKGQLNINSLRNLKGASDKQDTMGAKEASAPPEFQIDILDLSIGKVIYKDYSQGATPQITEFPVNIEQRFENITDVSALIKIILTKALMNTALANLTQLDFGAFQEGVTGMATQVSEEAQAQVEQAVESGKQMGEEMQAEAQETIENLQETLEGTIEGVQQDLDVSF
ncbi:hypothetical protein ACFL1E_06265 [Candidatus Omnitrophota bacterium]